MPLSGHNPVLFPKGNHSSDIHNSNVLIFFIIVPSMGFPCGSAGKQSTCNVGDLGSIPGLGRAPGEGKGYPLQYSGLENSMDYIVHGVAKSWTRLSYFDHHHHVYHHHVYIPKEYYFSVTVVKFYMARTILRVCVLSCSTLIFMEFILSDMWSCSFVFIVV